MIEIVFFWYFARAAGWMVTVAVTEMVMVGVRWLLLSLWVHFPRRLLVLDLKTWENGHKEETLGQKSHPLERLIISYIRISYNELVNCGSESLCSVCVPTVPVGTFSSIPWHVDGSSS